MKHLFIDGRHVQFADKVSFKFHKPVKEEGPVITPEYPWEGDRVQIWNAPVWSEARSCWRMWYFGGDELLPLYAESYDGLRWRKPELGLFEWRGSKKNNIVNPGFSVKTPKGNRIVLVEDEQGKDSGYRGLTFVKGCLKALYSSDGLEWTPVEGVNLPTGDEYRLGYDSIQRRFAATVKILGAPVPELGRAVRISLSHDFREWTEPELAFWADERDREDGSTLIEKVIEDKDRLSPLHVSPEHYFTDIYYMPVFTYGDSYIGLPVIFNQSGPQWHQQPGAPEGVLNYNQDGILYPSLAISSDLYNWERPDRSALIEPSPLSDENNCDYGSVYPAAPAANEKEILFFYYGTRHTHVPKMLLERAGVLKPGEAISSIFLARMRLDGFVSACAGREPGVLLSRPVTVKGEKLYVNVKSPRGELRAELRDAGSGRVIPGYSLGEMPGGRFLYSKDGDGEHLPLGRGARLRDDPYENDSLPISEDKISARVSWKRRRDLKDLRERKIRICFYLRESELYSFWFGK